MQLLNTLREVDRRAIVATLGLKEMTQDTLVRSLRALRYRRDPPLERNVHRSQNPIGSFHPLRAAIAQGGGKKELTGRIDLEIEISNPCARLIANAILYDNSAILSRLLTKHEAGGNAQALALITKLAPAPWRHTHLKRARRLPRRRSAQLTWMGSWRG